jgi:hypothetical protein
VKYLVDANVLSEPTKTAPVAKVVDWLVQNERAGGLQECAMRRWLFLAGLLVLPLLIGFLLAWLSGGRKPTAMWEKYLHIRQGMRWKEVEDHIFGEPPAQVYKPAPSPPPLHANWHIKRRPYGVESAKADWTLDGAIVSVWFEEDSVVGKLFKGPCYEQDSLRENLRRLLPWSHPDPPPPPP